MGQAMTDEELIATLFISEQGEVRQLAQYDGKERVSYQYQKPPAQWPIDPAELAKPVEYITIRWQSVATLPEPVGKAIVRLYRERAEARLLAIEWYHEWANGPAVGAYSETARSLVEKSWRLERAVDKEMEHG